MIAISLTLLAQFLILALLLIHRPRVIQQLGQFFVDVADLRITGGRRHYSARTSRRRGAGRGSEPARAEVPGQEVMNELTSALVNLGAGKQDARQAAQLAMRSGIQDFGELFKIACKEASHVN